MVWTNRALSLTSSDLTKVSQFVAEFHWINAFDILMWDHLYKTTWHDFQFEKSEIVSVDKETIIYLHLSMSNCLVQC